MSTKLLNSVAVVFILLALGCVAGAISATTKRANIQGPSALAVLPDLSVWVSVEDALWHLDESGKRIGVVDGATLNVGGQIGNLMLHPNGQLVASVRTDPALYFLDPESALIQSRLLPQWQSDLSEHGSDAINYAFHEDGRVAIATGGGHAVAVFDAVGGFLGRTKPGTYEFTNGLWWTGDSLWTTDTNRQELVELDGNTLTEKSRVHLSKNCGGWSFLGMAAPSRGKASEELRSAPLATIVRFANGMTKGHATDVFSDGSQLDYPVTNTAEPRDIKWRGSELLVVDGASFSIKQYSDSRMPMANFGDGAVQAALTSSLDRRSSLERQHSAYLSGAIALFLIGFVSAMRAQALEKTQSLSSLNLDLSQLGTPLLPAFAQLIVSIKIFWPTVLAFGVFAPILIYLDQISRFVQTISLITTLLLFLLLQLFLVLFIMLVNWNVRRGAGNPLSEAIFNYRAIQFLKTDVTFWRLRQPDELPQETLMLVRAKGGFHWLVLTNRRLLVFVANLRDRTLAHEYPRSAISQLRLLEPHEITWGQKLHRFLSAAGEVIRVEFKDGTSLDGFASSTQTVRRMAAQLQSTSFDTPSINDMQQSQNARVIPRIAEAQNTEAILQAIASFLIPGLGQWVQNRSSTALLFFIAWLLVSMVVVVVAWTLWKSLAAVSLWMIIFTASCYIIVCIVAAWDAWRMRTRQQ